VKDVKSNFRVTKIGEFSESLLEENKYKFTD
jgi:hypothetical protein